MNAVVIVSYHFPPYGGKAVQRASKLAKYLPEFGWKPIVFTMPLNEPGVPMDQSLLDELPSCVEIYRPAYRNLWKLVPYDIRKYIHNPIPDRYRTWVNAVEHELLKLVDRSGARALISTSPTHSAHLLGLAAKEKTGIPWIADFRDPWMNHPDFAVSKNADLMIEMESSVIGAADAVVGVFPNIVRSFEGRIPVSKLYLVENGYDEEDFTGVDWKRKPRDGALWMGYNGTVSDFHDPLPLLEPLESLVKSGKLDPAELRIVFTTGEGGKKRFTPFRILRETGVLELCGYLPHDKSLIRMSEMDVLILLVTKARDIYTGKVFEYFYLGNPILSLSTPGDDLDMLLQKTSSGIVVDYRNPDAVKQAVLELVEKKKRGELYRLSHKRKEISRFSRRFIAERYAEILNKISGI